MMKDCYYHLAPVRECKARISFPKGYTAEHESQSHYARNSGPYIFLRKGERRVYSSLWNEAVIYDRNSNAYVLHSLDDPEIFGQYVLTPSQALSEIRSILHGDQCSSHVWHYVYRVLEEERQGIFEYLTNYCRSKTIYVPSKALNYRERPPISCFNGVRKGYALSPFKLMDSTVATLPLTMRLENLASLFMLRHLEDSEVSAFHINKDAYFETWRMNQATSPLLMDRAYKIGFSNLVYDMKNPPYPSLAQNSKALENSQVPLHIKLPTSPLMNIRRGDIFVQKPYEGVITRGQFFNGLSLVKDLEWGLSGSQYFFYLTCLLACDSFEEALGIFHKHKENILTYR